jgi:hypothetical protein
MLRNSFKILLAISLTLSSVACATGGPIVETCLMNGQSVRVIAARAMPRMSSEQSSKWTNTYAHRRTISGFY